MKAEIISALVGATLFIGPAVAQQQITGTAEFCIKGPTGPIKCEYRSIAQCEQGRPKTKTINAFPARRRKAALEVLVPTSVARLQH